MKYKNKYDIGERVECIFTKDIVEMLKVLSTDTWINKVPKLFIEFLNENYDASMSSVKFVPNIYFELNEQFRNDSFIIRETIKGFKKHNRLNEINIRYKPLKKRNGK